MNYTIHLDADGDPWIVPEPIPEDGWTPLTDRRFPSVQAALDFVHASHAELIVDAHAARWWDTELCFADEPSRPGWGLTDYRRDQGGIGELCEVADVCPLLNDSRACHGIVWCPVYNLGWTNSHNCTEDGFGRRWDLSREERRERELAMIAEARRARRYVDKGLDRPEST